jgi:hypothetical protein
MSSATFRFDSEDASEALIVEPSPLVGEGMVAIQYGTAG